MIMEILFATAISFIEDNSDLSCTGPTPQIEFLSARELAIEYYGMMEPPSEDVHGIYDHFRHVIMLRDDFDPERDFYILLHETVHHCQNLTAPFRENPNHCAPMMERQAYELHELWLDRTGDEGFRHDPFTLLLMETMCKDPSFFTYGAQ